MRTSKFCVGDRVVVIKECRCSLYKIKKTYTIMEKSSVFDQYYAVEHPSYSLYPDEIISESEYNSPLYQALI